MAVLLNLSGQRFTRLKVLHRGGNRGRRVSWICRCDCGKRLMVTAASLKSGNTRSCGCLATEIKRTVHITHGHSAGGKFSSEYIAWSNMIRRGTGKVAHYAKRGITVCTRWLVFENFIKDMGPKPSPKHSLEREDNDRGYTPLNCRWATRIEQARNMATNHHLTVNGVTRTVAEWSEVTNLKASTIRARIKRGWDAKAAMEPV